MEARILEHKKPQVKDLRVDTAITPGITGHGVSVDINEQGEMKEYNEIL